MSCVWMLQRGHSGDGFVLASTLCKYDLRKGDLFVSQLPCVRYYVFVKSSFKHTREECESKRAYVFRCLIFNLSGPCELLFLLCFIASWT